MAGVYAVPVWFFGFDMVMELVFAVTALVISLFAFKVYRLTKQMNASHFAMAFAFISASYFIESLMNLLMLRGFGLALPGFFRVANIGRLDAAALIMQVLLMVIGLCFLCVATFRFGEPRAVLLLFTLAILAIFLSKNMLFAYFTMSCIILFLLSTAFFANYIRKPRPTVLLVALAFAFFLLGRFHFLMIQNHGVFYVLGHVFELLGYVCILANLYMVRHNG